MFSAAFDVLIEITKVYRHQNPTRGSKAYRCLNPIAFKVHISKDMVFVEPKSYKFHEHRNVRRISLCHSSTLQVTELEELMRENAEDSR